MDSDGRETASPGVFLQDANTVAGGYLLVIFTAKGGAPQGAASIWCISDFSPAPAADGRPAGEFGLTAQQPNIVVRFPQNVVSQQGQNDASEPALLD